MNLKRKRSRVIQPLPPFLGLFAIPFLKVSPPKQNCLEIDSLSWSDEEIADPYDNFEMLTNTKVSKKFSQSASLSDKNFQLLKAIQVQRQAFQEMVYEGEIIGLFGQIKQEEMLIRQGCKVIKIGHQEEVPSLEYLRPYSLSKIFIDHKLNQYFLEELFQTEQTFSIKIQKAQQVIQVMMQFEKWLLQKQRETLVQNIVEKLKIQISVVGNSYWIQFNEFSQRENPFDYLMEKLNLSEEQDYYLLSDLVQSLTLIDLVQLVNLQKYLPQTFSRQAIISKLKKKPSLKFNKIIENTSHSTNRQKVLIIEPPKSLQNISQTEDQNNSSLDIYMPLREDCLMPSEEFKITVPSLIRRRSRSADFSGLIINQQISQINSKILNDLEEIN